MIAPWQDLDFFKFQKSTGSQNPALIKKRISSRYIGTEQDKKNDPFTTERL